MSYRCSPYYGCKAGSWPSVERPCSVSQYSPVDGSNRLQIVRHPTIVSNPLDAFTSHRCSDFRVREQEFHVAGHFQGIDSAAQDPTLVLANDFRHSTDGETDEGRATGQGFKAT